MAEIEKPPPYPVTSTNPERSDYTCQPPQGHTSIPQGYHNVPTSGLPKYGSTVCVHSISQPQILVIGGCPACRVGLLEDEFTCLGICLAILFFPLGILCCLALKQRRCPNCGAVFG